MVLHNINEHEFKEMLKKLEDDSPTYTEQIKYDLKVLLNTSKICVRLLYYIFSL